MNCPKCDGTMEAVTINEVEIDRCSNCAGLYFDMLEERDLLETRSARKVDIGDADIGKERDLTVDITCPRDGVAMMHMTDPAQQHIEFESCPLCYGRFFDAGEFSDLARTTLFDWFRTTRARRGRIHPES